MALRVKILLINDLSFLKGGAEEVVFDIKHLFQEKNHQVRVIGRKQKKKILFPFSRGCLA